MSRLALPALVTVAAGLAALIGMELMSGPGSPAGVDAARATAPPAPAGPRGDLVPGQIAALLARPPFSPSRRPDAAAANGGDSRLPHLTGITVTGQERRAIFAGADGARAAVLGQGDQIGAYRVQAISPAEVVLSGPDGAHTVRPTFSAALPAEAAPSPFALLPPPPLPSPPPPSQAFPVPPFPVAPPLALGQGRSP